MKCDCLARRAILFVSFIIATTVLYGFTTKFLFTAPNYDAVSIDPEGGSYYDYGSKVAAAVWKGAGQWIGTAESSLNDVTIVPETSSKDAMQTPQEQSQNPGSTQSDAIDRGNTFLGAADKETVSRRRRSRPRGVRL
ncbi:unnamed protein product [Aureobasidium uvarum]|uniref:Uncharacterized protein n=1 Tax=Aureobasidium uvarum TaxID=2773716 RepID=A0A9N8PRE5_9PEZI|nr:unnamed protein product [Aureobasidium uvarum]